MALNNSVSKQQFAFSKSSRFPSLKQNTKDISHSVFNKDSDFDRTKNFANAGSFAFGSRQQRFNGYNTSQMHASMPSPNNYQTQPKTFSPDVSRSNGWSLGLGRGVMNKLHIDRLQDDAHKKIASPSPNSYEKDPTFGKQGTHYTMRKRMHRYGGRTDRFDDYNFAQEKKLPGPGYYAHPETVGSRMAASTLKSSQQSSMPKAQDRFRPPNVAKVSPSPDSYSPKADIVAHIKSNHPKVATTKFGLDKSDILDNRWGKKSAETTPGPGSYGRWSDFAKEIK